MYIHTYILYLVTQVKVKAAYKAECECQKVIYCLLNPKSKYLLTLRYFIEGPRY